MYLEELSKYKIEIMKRLCLSEKIQSLILLSEPQNTEYQGKEMMYKNIFPYAFVPDTVTSARTFICFDLEVQRVENRTFKDIDILFWTFTHQSLMRTGEGVRPDLVANEIDKIINGNRDLGLGTVELKKVLGVNPAKDYHGRSLIYRSVDFNRAI